MIHTDAIEETEEPPKKLKVELVEEPEPPQKPETKEIVEEPKEPEKGLYLNCIVALNTIFFVRSQLGAPSPTVFYFLFF